MQRWQGRSSPKKPTGLVNKNQQEHESLRGGILGVVGLATRLSFTIAVGLIPHGLHVFGSLGGVGRIAIAATWVCRNRRAVLGFHSHVVMYLPKPGNKNSQVLHVSPTLQSNIRRALGSTFSLDLKNGVVATGSSALTRSHSAEGICVGRNSQDAAGLSFRRRSQIDAKGLQVSTSTCIAGRGLGGGWGL